MKADGESRRKYLPVPECKRPEAERGRGNSLETDRVEKKIEVAGEVRNGGRAAAAICVNKAEIGEELPGRLSGPREPRIAPRVH